MLSRPILGRRVKQHSLQAARAQPSTSQQQVSDTPRGMGLLVEDEFLCPKSGYSIDMRVQDKCRDLGAIEFDESSHFLACTAPTGVNLIKRRHLKMLGLSRLHPCQRALLGVGWAIGNGRKEEVSARQTALQGWCR
jgi:hypothetical protein